MKKQISTVHDFLLRLIYNRLNRKETIITGVVIIVLSITILHFAAPGLINKY